jgi:GNAT superfamily N-acetyltransferase
MVKFILAEEVLPLRSLVLRNNKPLNECIFDSDNVDEAFHLGFFIDDKLISVASFLPSNYFDDAGRGFQLRGMATDPSFAGKGYGTALIGFGIDCLKEMNIDYIWCNARSTAASFYKKIGFTTESPEFDIPGIGFHYEMKLDLKK